MAENGDWILKIISGPHQGVEEMLPEGRLLVGTGPDCGIVLHDVLIAPQHFALTRKGGTVTVEALEGRTYCRGKRVTAPTTVPPFSFVTAGTTHVVVGPAAGTWPLLSSADAPELEKDPPPASAEAAKPAAAPAESATAKAAAATAPTPATPPASAKPGAPTPEQRRRAWWMAGFGGIMLVVWLVLWLLLRPAPSEPSRPGPKARTERVLGTLPGGSRVRIEERGDQLAISGYLESDAAHRDLIAALRAEVPEASLRLWSTPRIVETARTFLATRKLNLTLTPGENGELTVAGTAPSAAEWALTRQMLLAEVPGLQKIIDEVTVAKEPAKGSKAPAEPAVAPDRALTVIALQTAPEAPAWIRLANGTVYFTGGSFQGIATFTGMESAKARFEHSGGASLFGLGDNLAVLLPGRPANDGPTRSESAPRRAKQAATAAPNPRPAITQAAPAPAPIPVPARTDTKPVEPSPAAVAPTRTNPIGTPPAEPTPAPASANPAPVETPAAVAATPTPAVAAAPATETAAPTAPVAPEAAPASARAVVAAAETGVIAVIAAAVAPGVTPVPAPAAAETVASVPAPAADAAAAAPVAAPTEAKAVESAPLPAAAVTEPVAVAAAPVVAPQAESTPAPASANPSPVETPAAVAATPTPAVAAPASGTSTQAASAVPEVASTSTAASSSANTAPAATPAVEPESLPAEYVKNPIEAKGRLTSQVVQARDAGDFAAAQRALGLLVRLLPNDPDVVRLRAETEARAVAQPQNRNASVP